MTDDPNISRRYRELPREEPPRRVDDAILAAARRAVDARPAPLVTPAGRRRWYFPLAAAAIIVLAVAVTVQVERQQRDVEVAEAPAVVASEPRVTSAPREEPPAAAKREVFAPEPKPAQPSRPLAADLQKAPAAAAPAPAAPVPAAPAAPAEAMDARESAPAQQALRARAEVSGVAGKLATESPEQWLQGIADLRRQGRHEEADRQLAEFRKRYPDYRIPEAITEKFEKR